MPRTRRRPAARDVRVVFITAAGRAQALTIGRALVRRRLAACVNCVPQVRSIFRWQGRVDDCAETLLIVKTITQRLPALRAAVARLHSYALPEILVLPASGGSPAYLRWVVRSCAAEGKK